MNSGKIKYGNPLHCSSIRHRIRTASSYSEGSISPSEVVMRRMRPFNSSSSQPSPSTSAPKRCTSKGGHAACTSEPKVCAKGALYINFNGSAIVNVPPVSVPIIRCVFDYTEQSFPMQKEHAAKPETCLAACSGLIHSVC